MSSPSSSLGPLRSGARVVVVGGGPAGAGSALALNHLARQMGRSVDITVFEGKVFAGERHFNQCAGVLSPPIAAVMEESLAIPFPRHLIQREIAGYVLHSDRRSVLLESDDPPSYAVRRVQFDDHLLESARAAGIRVVAGRVTDLEFHDDRVVVYAENGNAEADAVIGAFGADDGAAAVFARAADYRAPRFLSSIVTKLHPGPEFMEAFGDRIHAFLPSMPGVEFGAVTPKGNHLTMNIAGEDVDAGTMHAFLRRDAVRAVLPRLEEARGEGDLAFFKGRFPISPSRAFYGDRWVVVGDAAGLVRPFKGKGVTSALQTGARAARTMLRDGISGRAFREYHRACRDITDDIPYGKAMRAVATRLRGWGLLDYVVALAERDAHLRRALFGAVSAQRTYRAIVHDLSSPRWIARTLPRLVAMPFRTARQSDAGNE
jgi:flavin-dependent dehydrogenase